MKNHFACSTALYAALVASAAAADMYKWVDRNGTVHFGDNCPEGAECILVRTDPPPSQEEVEAAIRRSEEILRQRQAKSQKTAQERQQALAAIGQQRSEAEATTNACETAFAAREILAIDLPVYRDDAGVLHHHDSLHHHLYEGERHYLDTSERATQLAATERMIAAQCAGLRPSRLNYVYRYRDKPNLDETLDLLSEMTLPDGPPVDETCDYARLLRKDLEVLRTGIPSDKERELARLIADRCR